MFSIRISVRVAFKAKLCTARRFKPSNAHNVHRPIHMECSRLYSRWSCQVFVQGVTKLIITPAKNSIATLKVRVANVFSSASLNASSERQEKKGDMSGGDKLCLTL